MAPTPGYERLYVVVSAGTLATEDSPQLENQGLGGACQQVVELTPYSNVAEASFSRLLFQSTSFHCAGRPFHLVVTVCHAPPVPPGSGAPPPGFVGSGYVPPQPEGAVAAPPPAASSPALRPLACLVSSAVLVDARKRSKSERPKAAEDDVRLVNRQRGGI